MSISQQIQQELESISDPKRAKNLQWFFKTGKGEYGEGDIFIGLRVPQIRTVAKKYYKIDLFVVQELLDSAFHEIRFLALVVLNHQYKKKIHSREEVYALYVKNFHRINNWDLVDVSAKNITGAYLFEKEDRLVVLQKWAKSQHLWTRRIAVLSCFHFIPKNQFSEAIEIAEILVQDPHDLMHKAVGWMLREIGKRDQEIEEKFLKKHYQHMPRTMLRYAIEKFEESKRQKYLKGEI